MPGGSRSPSCSSAFLDLCPTKAMRTATLLESAMRGQFQLFVYVCTNASFFSRNNNFVASLMLLLACNLIFPPNVTFRKKVPRRHAGTTAVALNNATQHNTSWTLVAKENSTGLNLIKKEATSISGRETPLNSNHASKKNFF